MVSLDTRAVPYAQHGPCTPQPHVLPRHGAAHVVVICSQGQQAARLVHGEVPAAAGRNPPRAKQRLGQRPRAQALGEQRRDEQAAGGQREAAQQRGERPVAARGRRTEGERKELRRPSRRWHGVGDDTATAQSRLMQDSTTVTMVVLKSAEQVMHTRKQLLPPATLHRCLPGL